MWKFGAVGAEVVAEPDAEPEELDELSRRRRNGDGRSGSSGDHFAGVASGRYMYVGAGIRVGGRPGASSSSCRGRGTKGVPSVDTGDENDVAVCIVTSKSWNARSNSPGDPTEARPLTCRFGERWLEMPRCLDGVLQPANLGKSSSGTSGRALEARFVIDFDVMRRANEPPEATD